MTDKYGSTRVRKYGRRRSDRLRGSPHLSQLLSHTEETEVTEELIARDEILRPLRFLRVRLSLLEGTHRRISVADMKSAKADCVPL
jgi:hypothetical protein